MYPGTCGQSRAPNHNALLHDYTLLDELNVLAVFSWFYSAFRCIYVHLFANVGENLDFKYWKLPIQSF